MNSDLILGTFVREEKNRFLCTVSVDGHAEEGYIPSSCKLENFLELSGKEVLLKENRDKSSRTRFAVYAIKYKRNYLLLKTTEANKIIRDSIRSRRFSFLGKRNIVEKECVVSGYKSDLFLPETQTIIEIKSIISTEKKAVFPTVYSERAINQLRKINELLCDGYKFVYVFVSLNPYVENVSISEDVRQCEFKELFLKCVGNGMFCKAYSAKLTDKGPEINKEIQLNLF